MERTDADRIFARFQQHGDPADLAKVFDLLAPQLLLVAQHLSRNGVSAEDLVQDTFVRAIETIARFDPNRRTLPWLLGILSGEAQNARRKAERVPDPHRLSRSAAPIPHEIAEAEEFQTQLATTLDELPATYRDVLNLRLVHGLTPTEIAHALGRAPETVKTQLRRGRDLLQAALPASFASIIALIIAPSDSLQAIRAQLIELARQHFAPISTSAGSTGEEILARSTRLALCAKPLLLATLLAAAAAAIWITQDLWQDDGPPITDYTRTAILEPEETASNRRALASPSSTKKAETIKAVPHALFRGRILTTSGGPGSEQRVDIFRFAPDVLTATPKRYFPGARTPSRVLAGSTVTDRLGYFELAGTWPESLFVVTYNHQVRVVTETPTPEFPVDLGDLILSPDTKLAGRVVDASGKSAAGARVRATALGAGFLAAYPIHELLDASLVIFGERGQSLSEVTEFWSTVLSLQAKPSKPSVFTRPAYLDQVKPLWPFVETTADASGRFELTGLPRAKVSIVITYPGHKTLIRGPIDYDPVLSRELGTYELEPGAQLTGRVFDALGAPLADAEVCFANRGANGAAYHFANSSVRTDLNGKFIIYGLRASSGYIAYRAQPGDRWTQAFVEDTSEYVTARLRPTHSLRLSFQSTFGEPVNSPDIALVPGTNNLDTLYQGLLEPLDLKDRMTTEEGGLVTVDFITPGDYTLIVRASGHQAYACAVQLRGNLSDTITLERSSSYVATVLGTNLQAVAGAEVYARGGLAAGALASTTIHCGTTNADGQVTIDGLSGPEVTLTATHAAHGIGHVHSLTRPDADWKIRLSSPGQIRGRLIGIEPEEALSWSVAIRGLAPVYALPSAMVFTHPDDSAKFSFNQLAKQDYIARALPALDKLLFTHQLTRRLLRLDPKTPTRIVQATSTQFVELPVASPRTITGPVADKPNEGPAKVEPSPPDLSLQGTVLQHQGQLGFDTTARLHPIDQPDGKVLTVETDEAGSFKFDRVHDGKYTLVLRGPGPGRKIIPITVSKEDRLPVNATLQAGVFINGRLDRPGKLRGIQFILQDKFGNWLNFKPTQVRLNPDGSFTRAVILPAGRYQITPAGASVAGAYPFTEYLVVGDRDREDLVIPRLIPRRSRPDMRRTLPRAQESNPPARKRGMTREWMTRKKRGQK